MLRHLLMTPPSEPRRVLPRRLQSLAHDIIRPLYYYVVPHRVPKRHELEIICTCSYPLFTLCTPRTSPYDVTDKEQNVSSETSTLNSSEAAPEVGSHVMGEFPLKAELSTFKKINNELKASIGNNNMVKRKEDYKIKECKRRRVVENVIKGGNDTSVSCNVETLHESWQDNNKAEKEALQEKEKEPLWHEEELLLLEEESSNRLFQVKARGMRRLRWSRTILHPWELWRKQHTTYMHTIHPNVIPGRPACYRCDICDGFQSTDNNKNTSTATTPSSRYTSSLSTSNKITNNNVNYEMKHEVQNQIAGSENKMENMQLNDINNNGDKDKEFTLLSDHHVSRLVEPQSPLQSSIAAIGNQEDGKEEENTKHIAQVAQLRYLDPFHVEVHHRPPLASLAFNLMRPFYAQLRRCGIDVRELSKRVKYVPLNSTRNARYFDSWVKQERKRRFHMLQSNSTKEKIQYYAHGVHVLEGASYAIRFAIAVYGLPYELGYFNSVQGLLKLQAEPHCRYVYATSQEQMDSMKRMLHGDGLRSQEYEFALSRYSVNVNEASFAVVIDHAARIVIVTFRGTLTLADAVVDIMEGYVNVNLCREPLQANQEHLISNKKEMNGNDKTKDTSTLHTRIPVGFFESVRNAALTLVPALNAIFAQHKDYVLYITGHSLGAVQASLFHLLYCTSSITMAVVNDPEKAALMPSEQHKTEEQKFQASEEINEENCYRQIQPSETNFDNINERTNKNHFELSSSSQSSSEEAITDALIKVKCNKVHTFAFAPAPMVEVSILPQLHELLHQEEYFLEEEMQNQRICGNSLSSFVYGQDPVSRVDVRSFLNVFAPSNSVKNETMLASVANAEICEKAECEQNTNETSTTVLGEKGKSTKSNNNNNMSFNIADACVPTLGIPGNLYCIPHTSRRCFFNVNVQAQWRKQLILTPEAMVHHFPVHYLRAVNKLRIHYTNQLNALRSMEHQIEECSTGKNINEQVFMECQKKFSQGESKRIINTL